MSHKTIIVTDDHSIRTVTLNRPDRKNAMTREMQVELIGVIEETAATECCALILTGAGDAFCSGLDLSELQTMRDKTPAEHRTDAERIARLLVTLYELPVPTIAAVNGPAIAGGTGLATLCDFTAGYSGSEVRLYRGSHRLCSGTGFSVSCATGRGQALPRSVADWSLVWSSGSAATGVGE